MKKKKILFKWRGKTTEFEYSLPQTPEEISTAERMMLLIHDKLDFDYIKDENYRKALETLHKEYHKYDAFMQNYVR